MLADVKDSQRMRALLDPHAPQVVFHAAAYKHVPVMEQNPLEAIRNNIARHARPGRPSSATPASSASC